MSTNMDTSVLNFDKEGLKIIKELWKKSGIIFNMDNEGDRKLFVFSLNSLFEDHDFSYLLEEDHLLNAFIKVFGKGKKLVDMVDVFDIIENVADNGTILYAE